MYHRQLPPLGIAIMLNYMDLWKILTEHIELTDEAKIEQLFYMISETEKRSFPLEEFKELLASLPVDKVDWALAAVLTILKWKGEHSFCLWKKQFAASSGYF